MDIQNIDNLLRTNSYPGRGILVGRSPDGKKAMIAYFIMGRSENSRNRIFIPYRQGIRTMAAEDSKLKDPSLIIYSPVRVLGNNTIVTNGDQTDTIHDFLMAGKSFEQALETRSFEPDEPNWTPRISGVVTLGETSMSYKLSILKSGDGNGESPRRYTFCYPVPVAGEGHFIHTYRCDGNPIPSFEGEPYRVAVPGEPKTLADSIWESLNSDNKVSLFVRQIDIATGRPEDLIINKYTRIN